MLIYILGPSFSFKYKPTNLSPQKKQNETGTMKFIASGLLRGVFSNIWEYLYGIKLM